MRPWLVLSLLASGIVAGYFLFHKVSAPDHSREHEVIDSTATAWAHKTSDILNRNDSLNHVVQVMDSSLSLTVKRLKYTEGLLKVSNTHATDLATIIEREVDTPAKLQYCDSLAIYVQAHSFQVQALSDLTDSLAVQHVRIIMAKDEQIASLAGNVRQMDSVIQTQYKGYNSLYKDYQTQVRQKKISAGMAKGLGIVALILGGILLSK